MCGRRSYRAHHSFSHSGNHRFFACSADQAVDIGTNRDPRDGDQLNAIFGHGGDARCFDDFGEDRHFHGFQDITSRQVYGRGTFEGHRNIGFVSGNHGIDNFHHIAAG